MGVCIAVAISGTLCRGVFQIIYGCHLIRVSVLRYATQAVLRPVALAAITGVGLYTIAQRYPADTWIKLAAYGFIFSFVYFGGALIVLGGADHARAYLSRKRAERGATEVSDTGSETGIDAVAGV
jgi:hypothetical protein